MRIRAEESSIRTYLREIGEIDLITPKEEIRLAALIKKGDEAATEKLITSNLRLVVKIAQDYAGLGLPLVDLISEGNIGLMKAVERFDPAKGAKLSTYGSWWIKQSIKRALANQSKTIRLPSHLVDKLSKMRTAIYKLSEEFGRDPTNLEVAEFMDVKPRMVAHWKRVSQRPTSLDAPIGDDEGSKFSELIGDDKMSTPYEFMNEDQKHSDIAHMMSQLDDREQNILKFRYGLQGGEIETLETVGARFKITRERVRQIQNSAIEKVRNMIEERDRPRLEEQPLAS